MRLRPNSLESNPRTRLQVGQAPLTDNLPYLDGPWLNEDDLTACLECNQNKKIIQNKFYRPIIIEQKISFKVYAPPLKIFMGPQRKLRDRSYKLWV